VWALAGIRGYVEATPTIGYRELAEPVEGEEGQFYIHGHMELAAQPFLGLGGELFIELDSPWWSPAPDKRWPWPLGELEYPLPGAFGIGADVDYVIGSPDLPEIEFTDVDFNAEKFMTDVLHDKVTPESTPAEQDKPGDWKEGAGAAGAEATSTDPAAKDTQGAPAEGEAPAGKQEPGEAEVPNPEVQERWAGGIAALGELAQKSKSDPYTQDEIDEALVEIRDEYEFTELRAEKIGEEWGIAAAMNPTKKATEEPKVVAIAGDQYLIFNLPDDEIKIQLDEEEVRLKEGMSPLKQLETLVNGLGIDAVAAKLLLKQATGGLGDLLLSFARNEVGTNQDPLDYLEDVLEEGRVGMAAVGAPVPASIRHHLVELGEGRQPLSNVALVFHELEPGQFKRSTSPTAGVTEYNFMVGGSRATANVRPRGIVRVANDGVIIQILALHPKVSQSELEEMMERAGWKVDLSRSQEPDQP
jgi:hypothetical protein